MSVINEASVSRKRLQDIFEQLANDRKLEILSYAADHGEFAVTDLKDDLWLPHTTAHQYCRELQAVGLLSREQGKPATYTAVEFDLQLSLATITEAVQSEAETIDYATDQYSEDIIEEILDVWEHVETAELTYREASATIRMDHADFLRVAAELELLDG